MNIFSKSVTSVILVNSNMSSFHFKVQALGFKSKNSLSSMKIPKIFLLCFFLFSSSFTFLSFMFYI